MDKNIEKKQKNPIVSVILPVYNGEKHIYEAINSILCQSFTDFELIIINDASTDNTENIINSFHDKRIKYIKNEFNLKISSTLNKAIELANGKYIARMDADDVSLSTRLEKQIKILDQNPDIDIVNIRYNLMSEDGTNYRKYKYNISPDTDTLKYLIYIDTFICHPGVMIRSELYKQFKYKTDKDTYNVEDCDLWIRMISNGAKCYTIKEALLNYRINNKSVTHTTEGKEIQIENLCTLLQNKLQSKFNLLISKDTLKIIKGFINEDTIIHINKYIHELNIYRNHINKIEKSNKINLGVYNWAEYCKFRTCIAILKANCNIKHKLKAIFILLYNLKSSFITIYKEYKNLYNH